MKIRCRNCGMVRGFPDLDLKANTCYCEKRDWEVIEK